MSHVRLVVEMDAALTRSVAKLRPALAIVHAEDMKGNDALDGMWVGRQTRRSGGVSWSVLRAQHV